MGKNYSVIAYGKGTTVTIRQTSTIQHAVKHAAYASELRIKVVVRDNVQGKVVITLPPIDKEHALKPMNKRDKRYHKLAKGN